MNNSAYTIDRAYIEGRMKLIPMAEKIADSVAGERPEKKSGHMEKWSKTWNRTFHSAMDMLARQEGLIR